MSTRLTNHRMSQKSLLVTEYVLLSQKLFDFILSKLSSINTYFLHPRQHTFGQKRVCIITVIPWLLIKRTNEKKGLLLIDMLQYVY